MTTTLSHPGHDYPAIRAAWQQGRELALIDLREEDRHAQAHPLFAVNIPLSKLELDIYQRIPHLHTPIVLLDGGEGLLDRAEARLAQLGYTEVARLAGDLDGWVAAGGELFRDVNSPSKAFGEIGRAHV